MDYASLTHTPVFHVTVVTGRRDAATGYAAWHAAIRDNRFLGTTLGVDTRKPLDPGSPMSRSRRGASEPPGVPHIGPMVAGTDTPRVASRRIEIEAE